MGELTHPQRHSSPIYIPPCINGHIRPYGIQTYMRIDPRRRHNIHHILQTFTKPRWDKYNRNIPEFHRHERTFKPRRLETRTPPAQPRMPALDFRRAEESTGGNLLPPTYFMQRHNFQRQNRSPSWTDEEEDYLPHQRHREKQRDNIDDRRKELMSFKSQYAKIKFRGDFEEKVGNHIRDFITMEED